MDLVKHEIGCADPGCDKTLRVKVAPGDINKHGGVKGLILYCRRCKKSFGKETPGEYSNGNYTGKAVSDLQNNRVMDDFGVKVITGDEARRFEDVYMSPHEIRKRETDYLPRWDDDN